MQHIFLQIIDICIFIFLKFSVISLQGKWLWNKTKKVFLVERVFGQKFMRNAKKFCFLFPSTAFAIFITQTLWLWSRIGGRVNMSIISNLVIYICSVLKRKFGLIFFPWTHFSVLLNCIRPNDVDISYPLFLRCQVAPKVRR